VVGMDPVEKVKGKCRMMMKLERVVDIGLLIVI